MEYDKIKNSFSQLFEAIGYESIKQKANYYLSYKEENNKTFLLRLQLNAIVNEKGEHPYYELALMEDEYDISCRDILKSEQPLQKLPKCKESLVISRKIFNNESDAKKKQKRNIVAV